MGDSERSVESFTRELLERLAQKVCALVDPDIRPEQVIVVFGPIFYYGVITCLWTKEDDGESTTCAYFHHPDCCPELKNKRQLPKLCIQTIISKSPPFVTTPNEWYEIQGISTENPVAKRIEV